MDQKELKTSWKQRVVAIVVLVVVLFTFIASYAGIMSANNAKKGDTPSAELTAAQEEYTLKQSEVTNRAASLSTNYFEHIKNLKSHVKAYNASTANTSGLQIEDISVGTGRELTDGDTNYLAYYIGWCSTEEIFDSSFDDFENPTSLKEPLSAAGGLIEGWNAGVIGMHIGGSRLITIPGELAYGETREICGGTNQPLKFAVYVFEDEEFARINKEMVEAYNKIVNYYYEHQDELIKYEEESGEYTEGE